MGSVGSWTSELNQILIKMKLFIFIFVSCVLAAAYAEADAFGVLPYGGVFVHGLKSAPCVNAANVPVPCAGVHYIGKREADSDAGFYPYGAYPSYYYGGHAGYPFAGHLIGKREADSDAGFYGYGAYPSYYYGGYAGHPYGVLLG